MMSSHETVESSSDAGVRLSIIVPNYNGKPHLDECFRTLLAQEIAEPFEVILSDNGSHDDSVDFVRQTFPSIKIVENGENLGFAGACNRGVSASRGSYVIILNNDVRLPPTWLQELVDAADQAPSNTFAVGSRLMLYHHPDYLNHDGAKVAPVGGGYDLGLGQPLQQANHEDPFITGVASGASVLYRRAVYEELGGMDESFFMYFEDVDLSLRAWIQGYQVLLAPRSIVYHKFGGTTGNLQSPIRLYWGHRNQLRIMWKSFSLRKLLAGFPIYVGTILAKSALQVLLGNASGALEIWRGARDGFRDLEDLREERQGIQDDRARTDRELVELGVYATFGELFREVARLRGIDRKFLGI